MECKNERIRMGIVGILAFCIMELLFFGGFGIAVPIVIAAFYIGVVWQYKERGKVSQVFKDTLFIPILFLAISFGIFSNPVLKFFNLIFLGLLMLLQFGDLFGINTYKRYDAKWFLQVVPLGLMMPFQNWGNALKAVKSSDEASHEDRYKIQTLGKIAIGCVIGVPILLIAGGILMGADAAFEGMMNLILSNIELDLGNMVPRLLIFIIVFFPLLGFFYGLTHSYEIRRGMRYELEEVEGLEVGRKIRLDFTIAMTIATLLALLYLLYFGSQLSYFISAFSSILPEDYTYSEYARRGFFEMIPIVCLNLGVIGILNLFVAGKEEPTKAKCIKVYAFFFIGFTLFIVITALSKMAMYMGEYGLTLKRIYVTWFLVLCVISLGLIALKMCKKKLKLCKSLFIVFTLMYLGLNYMNPDYQVARYNADFYIEKGTSAVDIESFYSLSLSAVGPFLEINATDYELYTNRLENYKWEIEHVDSWQEWNLSYHNANNLLKSLAK